MSTYGATKLHSGMLHHGDMRERLSVKEWIQEVLDEAEILMSCQFLHSGTLPSALSKDYDHLVETLLNNMEE